MAIGGIMDIYIALFLAHFIGDYPMQSDFLAKMKATNNYLLFCHVMAYTATITAVLYLLGIYAMWKILLLVISHFLIDYWKCHYADKSTALTTSLYVDQLAHFVVLIPLAVL
ncbi:MAG: DUF3307 domain-containing protein [Bacteroidales bacterium]|nr:DUF3307 domain-containing protein [Bacteroidales bacterium]